MNDLTESNLPKAAMPAARQGRAAKKGPAAGKKTAAKQRPAAKERRAAKQRPAPEDTAAGSDEQAGFAQPDEVLAAAWDVALQALEHNLARLGQFQGEFASLLRILDAIGAKNHSGDTKGLEAVLALSGVAKETVGSLHDELAGIIDWRRDLEQKLLLLREQHDGLVAGRHMQAERLNFVSEKRSRLQNEVAAKKKEAAALNRQLKQVNVSNRRLRAAVQSLHRRKRIAESRLLPAASPSPDGTPRPGRLRTALISAKIAFRQHAARTDDEAQSLQPQASTSSTASVDTSPLVLMKSRIGKIDDASGADSEQLTRGHRRPLPVQPGRWTFASEPVRPVVAVLIFGLAETEVAMVVERIGEELARKPDFAPVFVTDCKDFSIFRGEHYTFEYVPSQAEQGTFAPDLDWSHYLGRRAEILRRKWRPASVVSFGNEPPFSPEALQWSRPPS